ncbi:MAG: ATP-binding protein [Scytonema sp. PMC 1069.18]|nr:ATP-binding protein [Scytonema sp. PMC 1069.18]MEC4886148.1 ATP-binding protein [Scytonema sp. PMC 1070.18]
MAVLMRSFDWSQTPLGPVVSWSGSLRLAVSILLASRFPMQILWGPEYIQLYNDSYRPILGTKHPKGLGQRGSECWEEVWDFAGVRLDEVRRTGKANWSNDELLLIDRNGYVEECYFTFSYTPVRDESGAVGGIFNVVNETTQRVIGERRHHTQSTLVAQIAEAKSVEEVCAIARDILSNNPSDIPFALLYLCDDKTEQARLVETIHLEPATPASPVLVDLNTQESLDTWLLSKVARTGKPELVANLNTQLDFLPSAPWGISPHSALVLPIASPGQERCAGFIVVGISPCRSFDEDYRRFFEVIASHLAIALANIRAYNQERKRAEALVELDRAKTDFFSNVSHEFRTPLTLMLGPLERLINEANALPSSISEQLHMVHRNGLRLLKLVNTLLDFSRIEAGRVQAVYEPTDLAAFTAELASVFRTTIEQAGMRLLVDCPSLPEPVYVDREMWEKIVLNLLSNAYKFTFEGEIAVKLHFSEEQNPTSVILEVRDTGIGIPSEEIPHLFKRFHRVEGARGRTYEGTGIGLSLVRELVQLHGGTIEVRSVLGNGSCFTVAIPTGTAHLPQDRISATRTLTSTGLGTAPFLEEASRWTPEQGYENTNTWESYFATQVPKAEATGVVGYGEFTTPHTLHPRPSLPQILLVEDNADMRDYVKRLLSSIYEVETVSDGVEALEAIHQQRPDLVLTDVMVPRMDGFELLRELRTDPNTQEIPIIMLSARAGEGACVEGLQAGADDYLIKPFSARELLARIDANLKLARLRQQVAIREQELRVNAEKAHTEITKIFESITDGFVAFDGEWRYTYVNQKAAYLLQKTPQELLGQQIWEVFPELIGTPIERELQRAIAEQVSLEFEGFYQPFNIWLDIRTYPTEEGLAVYFRDITQRKRAEEALHHSLERERAARAEAESANRIKDEFLAVLSHELRSPLNPILGWAKLLRSRKFDDKATDRALETIERNAKLQAQLIEDLLDVSRILRGKMVLNVCPVNLGTSIEAAIETVRLAAEAKGIQIQTVLNPNVGMVSGDPNRLQQVLWNLLSNAVKFTPDGGRVEIRLEAVGCYAQIQVQDNGKGINSEFLPHVFEYFRQENSSTTRKFGGLGLGLAIVRYITEMHGGTVAADSPGEGQGATFIVRLPLMSTENRSLTPESNPNTPHPTLYTPLEGLHILIVDDEADIRDLVAFILEESGAKVSVAKSAMEAIAAIEISIPDVLVSDIGMPDVDGYMLMGQIRALPASKGGQIPAIALTAYAGEYNQKRALAVGFQIHLSKPVEPDDLVRAIASLIR